MGGQSQSGGPGRTFALLHPLLWTVISAVSAILFSAFLVYDLNRVARARGATEGEAIMLAVSVYLDIYNLFLDLLLLLSGMRR